MKINKYGVIDDYSKKKTNLEKLKEEFKDCGEDHMDEWYCETCDKHNSPLFQCEENVELIGKTCEAIRKDIDDYKAIASYKRIDGELIIQVCEDIQEIIKGGKS